MTHTPVLLAEVLHALALQPGETAVDFTAGRGGHAREMARAVGPSGRIVLFDRDAGNLAAATQAVQAEGVPVLGIHANFADAPRHLAQHGVVAHAALADLGFASTQVDDPARGFSFQRPGPLDMRLDPSSGDTAADLLARLSERELADAIFHLGEDPFARRIARHVVERRRQRPFTDTLDLAEAVRQAYGARAHQSRLHPATRTFMALRLLVNDELGALQGLLAGIEDACLRQGWLHPDARVSIISFHSLEDRLVKHGFAALERAGVATRLTRKPIEAGADEVASNPRARSAKMRALRRGAPK